MGGAHQSKVNMTRGPAACRQNIKAFPHYQNFLLKLMSYHCEHLFRTRDYKSPA